MPAVKGIYEGRGDSAMEVVLLDKKLQEDQRHLLEIQKKQQMFKEESGRKTCRSCLQLDGHTAISDDGKRRAKLIQMEDRLKKRVIGQEEGMGRFPRRCAARVPACRTRTVP